MKMERLLGIVAILQQKGKVTMPYLAERFEVSRRTIARDIEAICRAGIPLVTTQGNGGGVSIMEGYTLGSTVLTDEDMKLLTAGLGSVCSVTQDGAADMLACRLGCSAPSEISIDLASFYKGSLAPKIAALRRAIAQRCIVTFTYYYAKGTAVKRIEPIQVVFRWSAWYVVGFCLERMDVRLFKLARLWGLEVTQERYEPRELPPQRMQLGSHMTDDMMVTAIYAPEAMYRLVEEYGPDSFTVMDDGRLYTRWGFSSDDAAIDWLLSFGSRVQVTEPVRLKERMREEAQRMLSLHDET
ncbi:MAG: YafY family transcriptional regulator [Clostridia bacterium]|nr:YafY family transcriptional regulator [Clostridia bacterium]